MKPGLRMGLLFGGRSVEHEVSVISARGVAGAVGETELQCVPLGVTRVGQWLSPEVSQRILDSSAARVEAPADDTATDRVVVDPGGGGLLLARAGSALAPVELDVIFPLIHGWGGEDGRLQGLLELAGVPYVGADVLGSADGMDKVTSKKLFEAHGLPVGPWLAFGRAAYERDAGPVHREIAEALGFPVFVKPSNGGSSLGVTKVDSAAELDTAMRSGFDHDAEVVIEKAIDAREIECAVLGNEQPECSCPGEIIPSREFYDYAAKYIDGTSELKIPAPVEPETAERLRELACAAFRALKLRGFARVDFLVERVGGRIFLNEANTLPGFTPISMFPKLWEASGLTYPKLIERLVTLALEAS